MTKQVKGYFLPPGFNGSFDRYESVFFPVGSEKPTVEVIYPVMGEKEIKEIHESLMRCSKRLNISQEDAVKQFCDAAEKWKDPAYKNRALAQDVLPDVIGYSPEMIDVYLEHIPDYFDQDKILLLSRDVPDSRYYKDFMPREGFDGLVKGYPTLRKRMGIGMNGARSPEFSYQIAAGNAPFLGVLLLAENIGLPLGKAVIPNITKNASEEPLSTPLFMQSLEESELSKQMAVLYFRSSDKGVNNYLMSNCGFLNATGGEDAKSEILSAMKKLNPNAHVSGHWHKLSMGAVASGYTDEENALRTAFDSSMLEQYGCLSTQICFVEGGKNLARKYAEKVADAMETVIYAIPKHIVRGERELGETKRNYSMRKRAWGSDIEIHAGKNSDFLVIYSGEEYFDTPCFNRAVFIKPVDSINDIPGIINDYIKKGYIQKDFLQTMGVAIENDRLTDFADDMGKLGVSNIRAAGNVPLPKPGESWDGHIWPTDVLYGNDVFWTTIDTRDIDEELSKSSERIKKAIKKSETPHEEPKAASW